MSSAHRRFLVLEQGLGAAVINFVINAVIAWLVFHGQASVPFWGQQSIAGDTIGTCFLLPLLTCLIATPLCRRRVRAGGLSTLGWTRASHPPLAWLPEGTLSRGLVLGLVCASIVAPAALALLRAFGVGAMPFVTFLAFKATFAAGLAAVVTPVVALWAIAIVPGSVTATVA